MERKIVKDVILNEKQVRKDLSSGTKHSFLSKEHREERKGKVIDQRYLETRNNIPNTKIIRKLPWWSIFILGVTALLAFFILLTINAKADITVTPREKLVDIDSTLRAYATPDTPLLLSYNQKSEEIRKSIPVKTTGTKYVERKAAGKLLVYNNFSAEPIKLISNTRFKSKGGKIFRSYSSFYIPGRKKQINNSYIPGSIEIQVNADAPGPEYNIDQTTFTLPGLEGSNMATGVYAKSESFMSGGYKGETAVISDSDLEIAKKTLEGDLSRKLIESIKNKLNNNELLFDGAYNLKFNFDEYEVATSSQNNVYQVSMNGKISAVTFDKELLSQILARRELTGIGDENVIIENWPEINVEFGSYDKLDIISEISLRIKGTARFVWQFNADALSKDLAGITKKDYFKVFANYTGIESATVDIRPFWRRTFPQHPDDINVSIKSKNPG
ncbi:MAG TPA: hypothetical protein VJI73_00335 [Candidatus Paceibacterota bacterium]